MLCVVKAETAEVYCNRLDVAKNKLQRWFSRNRPGMSKDEEASATDALKALVEAEKAIRQCLHPEAEGTKIVPDPDYDPEESADPDYDPEESAESTASKKPRHG